MKNYFLTNNILIASDHAGYHLKEYIINSLKKYNINITDLGCNSSKDSVDYPDFAKKLVAKIIADQAEFGILICGSGIGISIAANRFKQIRAALCHNQKTAKLSRQHNNANVLCLGARIVNSNNAVKMAKLFLKTNFAGGRHQRRVDKL
jgi:ribose 5-phosphate isomerase B